MKIFSIVCNTFREAVRSRLLHSVLFFAAFVIVVSAVFGSVSIGDQYRVVKSFGYAVISLSGMICTVIAGVSLFQKEVTNKTIYNILSKPVSRTEFLLGKLGGLVLTSWVLVSLMMCALMLFVFPMEGAFDRLSFQALYVMFLEILIIGALTLFFSSVAVTPVLPGIFTVAMYVSGKSIFYLSYFLNEEGVSGFLHFLIQVVSWILPDLHLLTPYDRLLYGMALSMTEMAVLFIYSFSYATVFFIAGSIVFKYREL
jgi:ABC-type transport system involved in multi-copper enzyme maturation permease subunit